jgi:putative spermidine/putrescine transport system permease protein
VLATKKLRMKQAKYSNRKFNHSLLLLAPMILLYVFFILGGIISVFIESTGFIPALGLNEISASSYANIFMKKEFFVSLSYSLYIALVSTSISTLLGVLMAYHIVISRNAFLIGISKRILQVGMILPYLYMVFLTMITMGRSGLISRIFYYFGWIQSLDDFPEFLYEPLGLGIIFVYVLKGTPFVALFAINIMDRISNTYHEVSKTLGAKEYHILRKVYLPIASNTIVWTSSILFVYDLGAFEVPYLLGTNRFVTLSSQLYSLYINPQIETIPESMAMNISLLAIGSVGVFLYAILLKRFLKGGTR